MIDDPSSKWLKTNNNNTKTELIKSIKQADADKECGSGGCEMDALYKEALTLLSA